MGPAANRAFALFLLAVAVIPGRASSAGLVSDGLNTVPDKPQLRLAAEKSPTTAADRAEIQRIIKAQLAAFPRNDAEAAFSHASPDIRRQFGTAGNFMAMVRQSYATIFGAKQVFFRELVGTSVGPVQPVLLIDKTGASVLANYVMQKQADGSWRINGVTFRAVENKGI